MIAALGEASVEVRLEQLEALRSLLRWLIWDAKFLATIKFTDKSALDNWSTRQRNSPTEETSSAGPADPSARIGIAL